jgi:hypothetical protein
MPPGESEIGHGDILKRLAAIGRLTPRLLKRRREFPKTLDCGITDYGITVGITVTVY